MIGLSRTTGYAILTLRCLADDRCPTRSLKDIASCTEVPPSYLAKIVNTLARAGIVRTKRGVGGGITLARAARNIDLLEIVEAVEGPEWIADCLFSVDTGECRETCPTREFWISTRESIETYLHATTLNEVLATKNSAAPRSSQETCLCGN